MVSYGNQESPQKSPELISYHMEIPEATSLPFHKCQLVHICINPIATYKQQCAIAGHDGSCL